MYERISTPYLSKLFIKRNEIHDLNTRNNKALHIPQHKTVSGQRTFYYRAVKLWPTTWMKTLKSYLGKVLKLS